MFTKLSLAALVIALSSVPFIGGCASTAGEPKALTGSKQVPVQNDKGRVVGYQAH